MFFLAASGRLPLPANPLKTTTIEVYRGWQEELTQLQRRWNEIRANAREEREEGAEEAEGLRLRMQALRDLIAEAEVVGEDPSSWRTEVPLVRLGSRVQVEFEDGGSEEFLLVGLAGPSGGDSVLTPKTPLGAAIIGSRVGETVAYQVGEAQFRVVVKRCLVPGEMKPTAEQEQDGERRISILAGANEEDEANRIAFAVQEILEKGVNPQSVVVAWRAPFQSRAIETVFCSGGIRYRLEGTAGFYDYAQVMGIMALLRLLMDPSDKASFITALRILTHVPVEPLERLAGSWSGLETEIPAALAKDKGFAGVMQALRALAPKAAQLVPAEILADLCKRLEHCLDLAGEGFRSPWPGLLQAAGAHKRLRGFLSRADDIAAKSRRGARDGVILTPLELLGGRKFTALFLVGANEGALPYLAHGHQDSLPAERELFYGALSSAKIATLSWARTVGGKPALRSRFLAEVAETWGLDVSSVS